MKKRIVPFSLSCIFWGMLLVSCNNKPQPSANVVNAVKPVVIDTAKEQFNQGYIDSLNDANSVLYQPNVIRGARAVPTKIWRVWQNIFSTAIGNNFTMPRNLVYCGSSLNPQAGSIIVLMNKALLPGNKVWAPGASFPVAVFSAAKLQSLFLDTKMSTYSGSSAKSFGLNGDFLLNSDLLGADSLDAELKAAIQTQKNVSIDQFTYRFKAINILTFKDLATDASNNTELKNYFKHSFEPDNYVAIQALEIYGFKATLADSTYANIDASAKANLSKLPKLNGTVNGHLTFTISNSKKIQVSSTDTFTVFVQAYKFESK